MTRKQCLIALLLLLGLASASAAEEVRGVVTKIDRDKKVMEIETRGRRARRMPMTFEIGKDAMITVGRQPADLSSVQAGDRVFISFENRDGRNVATRVSTLGLRMALAGANPAKTSPDNMIAGTLARVDAKEREIVVMSPDPGGDGHSEVRLKVAESAHVNRDQKAASLEDLKEGDHILVRADQGEETALEIQAGKFDLPAELPANRRERLKQLFQAADRILQQRSGQPGPDK